MYKESDAQRPVRSPVRPKRYAGEEHRRAILLAAITVFGRYGYEGASTRKIAMEAGLEPGHLAYYYPTKEELLRDVEVNFASGLTDCVDDAFELARGATLVEMTRHVLTAFALFCAGAPDLTRLMLQEFSIQSTRSEWLIEQAGRPTWLRLKPLFESLEAANLLFGASAAVAYLNFLGATLIAFGNPEIAQRISGLDLRQPAERDRQIEAILKPILAVGSRRAGADETESWLQPVHKSAESLS